MNIGVGRGVKPCYRQVHMGGREIKKWPILVHVINGRPLFHITGYYVHMLLLVLMRGILQYLIYIVLCRHMKVI